MTNASFSEGITKEIALPEDDADSFGRIIEHLYGNNDAAFDINLLDLEGAEKLADMYGLAEKYQLPDFQDRVIRKLKQMDVLRENRTTFFHIARKICEHTRESDKIFEPYFAEQAAIHFKSMSKYEVEELSEMVCSGGSFAKKIVQIQGNIYDEMTLKRLRDRTSWKDEVAVLHGQVRSATAKSAADLAAAQEQLQSATAKSAADLAKASRMHKSQHPNCMYCHVLL